MTRALQSSLALANVKVKHGWQGEPLEVLQPRITQELGRKRPSSSIDTISDSSSSISGDFSSVRGLNSSPLTIPMFSDDFDRSGSAHSFKRQRVGDKLPYAASSSGSARKSRNAATVRSWKKAHHLPQSSPSFNTRHTYSAPIGHISKLSFISEGSTIPEETGSPELSEDDDTDLPVSSFKIHNTHTSIIQSSPPPPRTPPPQRRMINNEANISWSRTPRTGEEGADLLMFLATTPTPANKTVTREAPFPSTPPSKNTPLPSALMNTPGGTGLFGLAPNTPSNNFNFADFCNVTPSPAQVQWQTRTPVAIKTPLMASSARRRLNFDALAPPTSTSPSMTRSARRLSAGLGMELGGELLS